MLIIMYNSMTSYGTPRSNELMEYIFTLLIKKRILSREYCLYNFQVIALSYIKV